MTGWFNSVMDPLKSAGSIAKELLEIRDLSKIGDIVIKLQSEILSAQQASFAAQARESEISDEIRALKAKLTEFEDWEAEKNRYQLTDFGSGTYAYRLKQEMANNEPIHRLCPNCFQKKIKSILQFRHRSSSEQDIYNCPNCEQCFDFGVQVDRMRQRYSDDSGGNYY